MVVKPSGILIRRFGSKEKAEQFVKNVQKSHRPATGGDDDDPSQYTKQVSPKPQPKPEPSGKEVIVKTESGHTVATTTPEKTIQELTSQGQLVSGIYERPLSGGIGRKIYDVSYTPQSKLRMVKAAAARQIKERQLKKIEENRIDSPMDLMKTPEWKSYISSPRGQAQRTAMARSIQESRVKEAGQTYKLSIPVLGWFGIGEPYEGSLIGGTMVDTGIKQPSGWEQYNISAVSVYDYPAAEKRMANIMFQEMKKTDSDYETAFYSHLSSRTRKIYAAGEATTDFALLPITLSQTAEKYLTGKGGLTHPFKRIRTGEAKITGVIPEPSEKLAPYRITRTSGAFTGLVGEGVERLGGPRSDFFQMAYKYPTETVWATGGEYLGFRVFQAGIGKLKLGEKTVGGVKRTIRQLPIQTAKFERFLKYTPMRTESGALVQGRFFRLLRNVKATRTVRTAEGWAHGRLIRVRTYPLKKTIFYKKEPFGVTSDGFNIRGSLKIYKGRGRPEWVSTRMAEQFIIGKEFTFVHKYDPFGYRYQYSGVKEVFKPRGIIWKRIKIQQIGITERSPRLLGTNLPVKNYGFDGWVRSKVTTAPKVEPIVGISDPYKLGSRLWLSEEATASLVRPSTSLTYRPMMSAGRMHGGISGIDIIRIPVTSVDKYLSSSMLTGSKIISELDLNEDYFIKQIEHSKTTPVIENKMLKFMETGKRVSPLVINKLLEEQIQQQYKSTKMKTPTIMDQQYLTIQQHKPPTVRPLSPTVSFKTKPHVPKIIITEQKYPYSFSSKFFKTSWFGRGYRVRKLKIPRLKELLKGSVI